MAEKGEELGGPELEEPFLTSKSLYSLMDRTFRREKVLWFCKLPFGLQSSVLSAFTTLQLLPQQELPGSFAHLWCQRCIVVSNGYSIHGRCSGEMVSSHQVIIRLNDAPIKEHKKNVGERTRICLFFPESALSNPLENTDNDTLTVFVLKPLDFLWLREVLLNTRNKKDLGLSHTGDSCVGMSGKDHILCSSELSSVLLSTQPEQQSTANSEVFIMALPVIGQTVTYEVMYKLLQLNASSRRYATMGIIALNLALHLCQEVNIAGFGYPGNHDNTTPIHYYNTGGSRNKELLQHNITAERNWLLKMMESEVIADIASPSFQAQN
ncbi:LOW QUALITY PROTEIN: type 2 lactosamine alpha-2,3-sialyltransferase-like [Podargus strigoides]